MSAGSTVGVHKTTVWISNKHRLTKGILAHLAKLFVGEPNGASLQLHLQRESETENSSHVIIPAVAAFQFFRVDVDYYY